jgi:hypothetical protein
MYQQTYSKLYVHKKVPHHAGGTQIVESCKVIDPHRKLVYDTDNDLGGWHTVLLKAAQQQDKVDAQTAHARVIEWANTMLKLAVGQ